MRMSVVKGLTVGVVALACVSACRDVTAQRSPQAKSVHAIPDGVRGWVKVEYSSASCPADKDADGRKLIAVSATGTGCTRYSRGDGWENTEFRFGQGGRVLEEAPESACCQPAALPKGAEPGTVFVWGRNGWTCEPKTEIQVFFVGTVDEYARQRDGWQKFACDASSTQSPR